MDHNSIIQIIIWLIGVLVFIFVNAFKIGQLEAKLATKDQLNEKVKERNQAIDRVYERFDEFKNHTEETFVRRDMCGQLHLNTKDEITKLDNDYKAFRHEIRNQIQMLVDKIDQLKELIQNGKCKM
jgi:hypothetical protein